MKTVDLKSERLSLEQILAMAGKDTLLLRDVEGEEFLLTPADDFATEVELLRRNHEFLAFLDGRFASRKRDCWNWPRLQANCWLGSRNW